MFRNFCRWWWRNTRIQQGLILQIGHYAVFGEQRVAAAVARQRESDSGAVGANGVDVNLDGLPNVLILPTPSTIWL